MAEKKKSILFIHPDLGIGGAERLVVDAAVGLQERGHKVVVYTSHCDKAHAFDEARDGGSFRISLRARSTDGGQELSTSRSGETP